MTLSTHGSVLYRRFPCVNVPNLEEPLLADRWFAMAELSKKTDRRRVRQPYISGPRGADAQQGQGEHVRPALGVWRCLERKLQLAGKSLHHSIGNNWVVCRGAGVQ